MRILKIVSLAIVAVSLGACGGNNQGNAPKHLEGVEYPDWVTQGSGAFGGEEGRVFYGVGDVSGVKNPALARRAADNRARAEIQKIFDTYTATLMKDYMASTTAGDMTASSEEQHIEVAQKTFSAGTLSGVQIVNHWFHPDGQTVYALARLDLDNFKDSLDRMKELNSKVRDYVRKNAEKAHMDLEAEEAKRE